MTLACVMTKKLWLIMATHCIFLKKFHCLDCHNVTVKISAHVLNLRDLHVSKGQQNRKCENVVAK